MVEALYLVPKWFFMIDIMLGVLFAIVASLVSTYAYKIYRLTEERELKIFGFAFTLISLSYLIRTCMNVFLTTLLSAPIALLKIYDISYISKSVIFLYVFLFIGGYATLTYATLKIKGKRSYILLVLLSFLTFTLSFNKSMTVYLITSLFTLFISYHYINLYVKTKDPKRLNMVIATTLLFISNLIFMFIADFVFYQGYIISSLIELTAYLIISLSLYKVGKHGEKKK